MPSPNVVVVPGVGSIAFPDRDQMRVRSNGRQLSIPTHMMGLMEAIPPPPAIFDLSKAEAIKYPILGNNQYGDCFYAAAAHQSQTYTGNVGTAAQFDVNALVHRYEQLSGGDNGLSDGDIMPEFKTGIVGPNGPHKIIDWMTIKPSDAASVALGMWAFCGLMWTCALPSGWANNAKPGATWGTGAGHPVGGHAMHLTGVNAKGGYDVRTWGISPPINVTKAGLLSADPELIVCFSLEMFGPDGVAPHCGANYDQLAALWRQLGGKTLPPSPFPPAPELDWYA